MPGTIKVLVNEQIAQSGIDLLAEQFDVTVTPGWSNEELLEHIADYDGIVIRSATKLTPELIRAGTKLQVIGRAGVGVDNVDLPTASAQGIIVVNAPTSTVTSVAEHAIGLMLSVARNLPRADATMKAGEWARSKLGGTELTGKTVAILGLGRIGQVLAQRLRGLEMRVVGYDPFVSKERMTRLGVEHAETIDDALAQGDFVSLHLPLMDETRGLIDAGKLALMPKGSVLINAARGPLVDLDALNDAIESGHLGGAALDVYPVEPPEPHPVFLQPSVVCTPHIAASTAEAQDRAGVMTAEQVSAALTGGSVTTAVNVPAIAAADVAALQPFVPLAGRLARIAQMIAGPATTTLTVTARGTIAENDVRMLSMSALVAVLQSSTDGPVSFVNARQIAESRGLELVEHTDPFCEDYQDLLEVCANGESEITVSGTTIGAADRPFLTNVMGFDVDIEITDHMAIFQYADVPGMIGRVGVAFGEVGVNIANMAVSRRSDAHALMVISFDVDPPAELIQRISDTPDFSWAGRISFAG